MEALYNLLNNFERLDQDIQFKKFFDITEHKAFVISRNTWGQLFEMGVDAFSRPLPTYRPSTVKRRGGVKGDGTPFRVGEHYTLRDYGNFYQSFQVKAYKGFLEIDADTLKMHDGKTLFNPDDVVGLTDDSKEKLVDYMLETNFIPNDILETVLQFD